LNGKGYDLKARMALPGLATALRQATNYKQKKVMETLKYLKEENRPQSFQLKHIQKLGKRQKCILRETSQVTRYISFKR
jgi:Cdc6-like AAA superfamily ATPase